MTSLSVLCFIWTSHITSLPRVDFEVISRNLNSNPKIQVVQTGHVLKTQTTAQLFHPKWFMKPGSPWFLVLRWAWGDLKASLAYQEVAWHSLTATY